MKQIISSCALLAYVAVVLCVATTLVAGAGVVPAKPMYEIFPGDSLADASNYPAYFSQRHPPLKKYERQRNELKGPRCGLDQHCLSHRCDKKFHVCVGRKEKNVLCKRNYECRSYECDLTKKRCQ